MLTTWSIIGWFAVTLFVVNEVLRNKYGIHTNRGLMLFHGVQFVCLLVLLVAVIAIARSIFLKG